ncbi:hypothetical protein [Streptomyces sp. NPDC097619]|uniref:hypothetical protein n=1 Tax=Streptomyces sp. NPDC097619 TaxID=3157228 RepID=UPI003331032E
MNNPHPDEQPAYTASGDAEQAAEGVRQVIDWYNARLRDAREPGAGRDQVDRWREGRNQALDDLDRLEEADAGETVRIALAYAARLRELTDS